MCKIPSIRLQSIWLKIPASLFTWTVHKVIWSCQVNIANKKFFISLFTTLQSSEKETQSFLHIVNLKCKTPPLAVFSPQTVGYSKKTTTTYFALSRFLKRHLIYSLHIHLHLLQPIYEPMFILEVPVQPLNTRYLSAPRWMRRVERWLFQLQINVL